MQNDPPFDPPYKTTTYDAAGNANVVETLSNGTTRTVTGSVRPSPPNATPQNASVEGRSKAAPKSKPKLALSTKSAVLFLDVPFAEKDSAKITRARWDAIARKWYVPHGLDIHLFQAWWPESLKQDMNRIKQATKWRMGDRFTGLVGKCIPSAAFTFFVQLPIPYKSGI